MQIQTNQSRSVVGNVVARDNYQKILLGTSRAVLASVSGTVGYFNPDGIPWVRNALPGFALSGRPSQAFPR
jgi:hypothetical protein